MSAFSYKKGFSLLEILISIFLLTMLSALVYYSLSGFKNKQFLESNSRQVTAILEEARSLTISGQGGMQYGVHFQSDKVVRFSGSTYSSGTASNIPYVFDSAVNISNISLNAGGSDVVFDKIKGTTANYGSVELNLVSTTTPKKIIYINQGGIIDVQ